MTFGGQAEVEWIRRSTTRDLAITSAIPPVFERYVTLELPDSGGRPQTILRPDQHDAAVLEVLRAHTRHQPWWLGFLDTGGSEIPLPDAPKVTLYSDWPYVLIEAGPNEAAALRPEDSWKGGRLPDLMFPADRSWLLTTLWDDDWTCIGGTDALVADVLTHPELRSRAREVTLQDMDTTPPGHVAR